MMLQPLTADSEKGIMSSVEKASEAWLQYHHRSLASTLFQAKARLAGHQQQFNFS